ncbi:Somatostatin receptor type 5 [Acropora cervicornis]|uniref:Somatostatin receptor type 5 n=1 Tax=Acropora cervicornis TaxID=6130 RepID=A0AAD9QC62_ACRCE|nr:Somatostatin receptor type 5 [Acropora cervicornis]
MSQKVTDAESMSPTDLTKLTFEVLIALVGVVGNVTVVLIVSRFGKKRQPGDVYLQHLATADLGILLLAFPILAITKHYASDWSLGEFTCRYLYPIPETFYGASVWLIAVIAIERYRKVMIGKPVTSTGNKALLRRARVFAASVWMASFLIFSLPLYFLVSYDEPTRSCNLVWPSWDDNNVLETIFTGTLTFLSYILPLIVVCSTYLAISRALNPSNEVFKVEKRHDEMTEERRRRITLAKIESIRVYHNKRAKKILTPLVVVFAVTMLPHSILRLTTVMCEEISTQDYYQNLLYIISLFVLLNSSAKPIIYSVVSREFRRGMIHLRIKRFQSSNSYNLAERVRSHR